MTTFDRSNAKCHIYTFKDGLLSFIAHDLKLQVSRFKITIESDVKNTPPWRQINATFDPASIRAVCAMKNGSAAPGILSQQDCRDIERNMANDVLRPRRFLAIRFQSNTISGSTDNFIVNGQLTLCGITKNVSVGVKRSNGKYLGGLKLDQRDFGIEPFSAMMGTMKVKPEVKIRIEIPAPALPRPKPADLSTAKARR